MELLLGIVFIVAGVLLPVAAYNDKVGQVGLGSEPALQRSRTLTRGKTYVFGPLLVLIGVVMMLKRFGS